MWLNSLKYQDVQFKGSYERDKDGERVFVLRARMQVETVNKGKVSAKVQNKKITFESYQAAKALGWVKLTTLKALAKRHGITL